MINYERELTNCSLSLISHPSSVRPNEAPASNMYRHTKFQHLIHADLDFCNEDFSGSKWYQYYGGFALILDQLPTKDPVPTWCSGSSGPLLPTIRWHDVESGDSWTKILPLIMCKCQRALIFNADASCFVLILGVLCSQANYSINEILS